VDDVLVAIDSRVCSFGWFAGQSAHAAAVAPRTDWTCFSRMRFSVNLPAAAYNGMQT
jgi:hypothetical protein